MKIFSLLFALTILTHLHAQEAPRTVTYHPIWSSLRDKSGPEIKGSPYISESWASAKFTTFDTTLTLNTNGFTYNLNATNNEPVAKNAAAEEFSMDRSLIKSFILKDGDKERHFERVSHADFPTDEYLQVIYKSESYKVFLSHKKFLKKADFKDSGTFQTGNKYDEYISENEYYVKLPGKMMEKTKKLTLKLFEAVCPKASERTFRDFCSKNKISGRLTDDEAVKVIKFLNTLK